MPKKIDVIGVRFSRLKVLADAPSEHGKRRTVYCICDCGNRVECEPRQLLRGKTRSCGCIQREAVSESSRSRIKHGFATHVDRPPEYNTWVKIKGRCENVNDKKYNDYGGRGITVCDRWRNDFSAFLSDMGPKPAPSYSIDRINNDRGYSPDNCRWATPLQQSRNKRTNLTVFFRGRSMPLSQACEESGVNYRSALWRMRKGRSWMPLPAPPATPEASE